MIETREQYEAFKASIENNPVLKSTMPGHVGLMKAGVETIDALHTVAREANKWPPRAYADELEDALSALPPWLLEE